MFNTNSNLLTKSGLNVDQINALLAGHGKLDGLGQAFINAENNDGVNAFWGMAQAIEETGWGTSAIAQNKNNLFGITAYDANPYGDASSYDSPTSCVTYWADFIRRQYLTQGGAYYVSPTPAGVARHWASDPNYASQVVSIMNLLVQRSQGANATPAPAAPNPAPSGNKYVVKAGQNMSVIAQLVGLSLGQLESLNPGAGHPAGNFNVIWPGDTLNVGAAAPPAAAPLPPAANYVTVAAGDSLSAIASRHGLSLGQIEAMNPNAGHPVGHFDIIWPGDKIRVS